MRTLFCGWSWVPVPTLAVSTMASNGIGMGLAATFVLLCSNVVISALRKVIPDQVRIPCYITVIAGFVSVVQMLVKAFVPALDASLGVYLPLIVVNCIILGRAEMFASKNGIVDSALDGIGMGIGFTITLTIMGTIREILGSGTWMAGLGELIPALGKDFAIQVQPESIDPFTIMTSAPGVLLRVWRDDGCGHLADHPPQEGEGPRHPFRLWKEEMRNGREACIAFSSP